MEENQVQESITIRTYAQLSAAYDYFNREIFGGKLPHALITLAYHRGARGYFRSEPFTDRAEGDRHADEVALNPFTFVGRTDKEILSTLVHEQAHLWQHHYGTPPKRPVHNKEWATKMEEIGLMPSSTGEPGGKRTGRRVSHFIIEGGLFDVAYEGCEVAIDWAGLLPTRDRKKRSKAKYECPGCESKVRGKAGLHLRCEDCDQPMECDAPESTEGGEEGGDE